MKITVTILTAWTRLAGAFKGLAALAGGRRKLSVLRTLLAGVFTGLAVLTGLMLQATAASAVPEPAQSGRNITAEFTDANFLAAVRTALGKGETDNIYDTDDFASVASLNVSDKEIASLAGIGRFTALTSLDCSINELTALPALPSGLTELNCSYNGLTVLPALPSGLTDLDCSSNPLTSLSRLPSGLTKINCYNSLLTSLSELPSSLSELTCSLNKLTSLPALPSGLTTLNCADNRLTSLPALPSNLSEINCTNNRLTSLPALPSSLLELYCTNNRLTSLPALPSGMTRINCSDNQLTGLPDLPSGMTRLDCSGNLLASLPALPPVLTSLDCSRNRLTGVALNSGVRWDKLDVRYNYMTALTKVTGFSGTREGGRYDYTPQHAPDFRMVTNVIDLPADMVAVNVPLTLSGTVVPADATRRNIVWSIIYSGKTGATLSGNTITAKAAGTVAVRVKITGGYGSGKDFVKDFEINFK